ncbi:HAMP domain-containing histidine kinase [Pseudomonas fluorescens]|uniref:histidine kinase n=1 Tax=Pseudomonas fluorescens (strain Pf0-1) TaxID=205922 RepID=Q3K465_PSEPF|nr:HAMP domain-containing sensor histidine kinase [Pseudomonas fluorescens]ABA77439.1 two-component sensor histidine kinase transcriptional regulatory protein [Pseudomonas fluorescens Pf0-1]MBY9022631.1 HAMP domain-containing histidine kinase [Pseudomonas fluorescens]MBY9028623.1 HAMP domain-containing histidine kinase [Pseudomonas fluorescens]MBY9033818.1 HAMP domain-containing histidine kinase [Pseudomonas fluorescens]MBY9040273.1 HAMP domain-containing histidine kinase [Pseudomonas fluoresc
MNLALRWPRTLASRLSLIFLIGLILAQALSFSAQYYERYESAKDAMLGNLETDVSTSIAILDRLPAEERPMWLKRLARKNYGYLLSGGEPGTPLDPQDVPIAVTSITDAIGEAYPLTFTDIPGPKKHFQGHLRLSDGSPVTIDVRPSMVPLSPWLPVVLLGQLALMLACTWLAVRIAIRPLTRLANAVETLDPNTNAIQLDEKGPNEVVYAVRAFNAMQARITTYLKERMQLLAAISHDLQTPITRMKLRAEFMDDSVEKDKLWNDLGEMEHLVREGVAYARSIHGSTEESRRTNLDSFLDSLVFDYQDMGKEVQLNGKSDAVIDTRPHALRRVLVNLTDNALKFAGAAELLIQRDRNGLSIKVMDRGPGIAEEELAQVMEPFYRVENSRNRSTGGTGLGLAIAQQLALALGGSLTLSNRDGGGLCAELRLPLES